MNYGIGYRGYLIGIVNVLLVAGLFGFYQKFIAAYETRAEGLRRDLVLLEENRRLLKEREELLVAWQPYQGRFDHFFFAKDHLVEWLEFLEGEARARHLDFEVSSLDEKGAGNPSRLRATLQGTLADTIQFLRAVQTGPYGIGVEEGIMRQGLLEERITQVTFMLYAQ